MLRNTTDRGRIFTLILLSFFGVMGVSVLLLIIGIGSGFDDNNLTLIRVSIILQDLMMMFLPAYLVFKWSFEQPVKALGFKHQSGFGWLVFYTLIIYLASMPLMGVTARWNELIQFPESLKWLETIFRNMENSASELIDRFFEVKTIPNLLMNLFLIAFLAALTEEVMFRGAIQQLLHRWFKNGHTAVWIAAFIFSAIHMQFYGFVPRVLLGAVMGYLYLLTKNLWIPVIFHFVNNAAVVLRVHFFEESELTQKLENMEPGLLHWLSAAASAFVIYFLLKKMYENHCKGARYDTVEKKQFVQENISVNSNNNLTEDDTN